MLTVQEGRWIVYLGPLRELINLLELALKEDLVDSVYAPPPPISHFLSDLDKFKCIWKQAIRETKF